MRCYRCPDCGAFLDPNEICDCQEKEEAASQTGTLESGNVVTTP